MSKIKLIFTIAIIVIIGGLCAYIQIITKKLNKTKSELVIANNNNIAYESERDSLNTKNIQYLYTIDQLKNSKDSIDRKLNDAKRKLKIKDKHIKDLEYIASSMQKTDSIIIKDTIFKHNVNIDTLISDKWSSLRLNLKYPNTIKVNYSFNNETIVVSSAKKVTVKPPKKCKFLRMFQKKQLIVTTDVIQLNPYCLNKSYKSVKIIK